VEYIFETKNYWHGEMFMRDFVRIMEDVKHPVFPERKMTMFKEDYEKVCFIF
jgi:hypothetical protein